MDNLRVVDFGEAGEGVELFFRNSDLFALRKKYGPEYLEAVEKGLLIYDLEVIDFCLHVGAKRNGKPHKIDLDDLNGITLKETAEKILDAYSLSVNGRTFAEHMKWAKEQAEKLFGGEGAARPQTSPEAFLDGSNEQLSGQESGKSTSGE